MKIEKCKLCGKPADMAYEVDPNKGPIPLCGACMGKWEPVALDNLLGVKQAKG